MRRSPMRARSTPCDRVSEANARGAAREARRSRLNRHSFDRHTLIDAFMAVRLDFNGLVHSQRSTVFFDVQSGRGQRSANRRALPSLVARSRRVHRRSHAPIKRRRRQSSVGCARDRVTPVEPPRIHRSKEWWFSSASVATLRSRSRRRRAKEARRDH